MSWNKPLCVDCWNRENPERPATHVLAGQGVEICCMCGAETDTGIFIRPDLVVMDYRALLSTERRRQTMRAGSPVTMRDGDTCPCETFGIDPDGLPTDGVFAITWPDDTDAEADR